MDGDYDRSDFEQDLDRLFESAGSAFADDRDAVAVELLSPYLRHRPGHAWAWYVFGRCLQGIGLFREAERALLRAGEFPENGPRPLIYLGHLYKENGEYDAAEACFAQAVLHPNAADWGWVWIFRGTNLARANRLSDALDSHRHALTLSDSDHDEAWLNIGYVLRAMGSYEEALDAFRTAIELTPEYPQAREALNGLEGISEAVQRARSIP